MIKYPYGDWLPGAKGSLDKFIATELLDFDYCQYRDMLQRRGGLFNYDDKNLEALVQEVREGLFPNTKVVEEVKRVDSLSNIEVAEEITRFRDELVKCGSWRDADAKLREDVRSKFFPDPEPEPARSVHNPPYN